MKLIFCPHCKDIVKLTYELKYCECELVYGKYNDSINATISNKAIPIGIANNSFLSALTEEREFQHSGLDIKVFIIPENSKTIKRESILKEKKV